MIRWSFFMTLVALASTVVAQPAEPNEASASEEAEDEPVLARFKGEPLTAADLEPDPRTLEMNRKAWDDKTFNGWLEQAQSQKLTRIIFGTLLEEYREAEGIAPTPEEIDQFVEAAMKANAASHAEFEARQNEIRERLEAEDLTDAERARLESERETLESLLEMNAEQEAFGREHFGEDYEAQQRRSQERIGRQMITAWKTNRSLYERYGGRVIFQQAGPEPVDAYRRFLEEHRDAGDFEIVDPELREQFWRYFVNDRMHTFYDDEEGAKWMKTPWWQMENLEEAMRSN